MVRCRREDVARESAREKTHMASRFYGMSVLDGLWYVGTVEELRKVGVADVKPADEKGS